MTPCEEKGYKVGDRFKVKSDNHYAFMKGETIKLSRDDGTINPLFESEGGELTYCNLARIEPLTPQWQGPQDGLPPVGMRVNLFVDNEEVEVMCHGADGVFCGKDRSGFIGIFGRHEVEPIPSDRDRAIEEMTEIAGRVHGPTARDVAEELYRNGYRKTEES